MKILVAEDDPHILEGVCSLLEKEGYRVVRASDGRNALALYQREAPDFLILDIMMPGMNGYDLCKEIRSRNAQIPILFLSAKSEEIDRVVGLELGADDFIPKPFGTRELLARIRTVSRRLLRAGGGAGLTGAGPGSGSDPLPPEKFVMGDLEVLPSELRARRGEAVVDLSLRDVALLLLLWRRKGQVVDRNDLFAAGWGADFIGSTRALDQHISQLRKKIELDPANPKIVLTVHGAGYRHE